MDLLLTDRVAIVTGGASNIGRQVALTLAGEGASVAILDLDEDGAQRVAQEARTSGGRVSVYRTDITDPANAEASVRRVVEDLGKVDILANVAGWMYDELFLDETAEKQEKLVNVNLWGPMNMIRAALPYMVANEYGRVVSVASDAGRMGEYKEAVYSACKAGVIALSKGAGAGGGTLQHHAELRLPRPDDPRGARDHERRAASGMRTWTSGRRNASRKPPGPTRCDALASQTTWPAWWHGLPPTGAPT